MASFTQNFNGLSNVSPWPIPANFAQHIGTPGSFSGAFDIINNALYPNNQGIGNFIYALNPISTTGQKLIVEAVTTGSNTVSSDCIALGVVTPAGNGLSMRFDGGEVRSYPITNWDATTNGSGAVPLGTYGAGTTFRIEFTINGANSTLEAFIKPAGQSTFTLVKSDPQMTYVAGMAPCLTIEWNNAKANGVTSFTMDGLVGGSQTAQNTAAIGSTGNAITGLPNGFGTATTMQVAGITFPVTSGTYSVPALVDNVNHIDPFTVYDATVGNGTTTTVVTLQVTPPSITYNGTTKVYHAVKMVSPVTLTDYTVAKAFDGLSPPAPLTGDEVIYFPYDGTGVVNADSTLTDFPVGSHIFYVLRNPVSGQTSRKLYSFALVVGATGTTYDIVPDSATFAPQANANASTVYTSETKVLSGVTAGVDVPISVTGGTYAIDTTGTGNSFGAYTADAGFIRNGWAYRVQGVSNSTLSTSQTAQVKNVVLTIGDSINGEINPTFSITNRIPVVTPGLDFTLRDITQAGHPVFAAGVTITLSIYVSGSTTATKTATTAAGGTVSFTDNTWTVGATMNVTLSGTGPNGLISSPVFNVTVIDKGN